MTTADVTLEPLEPRRLLSTSFSEGQILAAAQQFPAMPRDTADLVPFVGGLPTFTAGTPFNDLGITLLDTDYVDGENGGGDTFMPVDPSDPLPGTGQVKYVRTVLNVDLSENYGAAYGDRIILGTAEIDVPFFTIGPDGIDNDYVAIQHFDYQFGAIQLRGTADDYELRNYNAGDGVATAGNYLFYTGGGALDLVAFVFNFDDFAPTVSGALPNNTGALGNGTGVLDLNDPNQFLFAQPVSPTPAVVGQATQVGTNGKEIVEAVAVDASGNTYLAGATDGTFVDGPNVSHRLFVSQTLADGSAGWTTELPMREGSTLKAAIADSEHVYVAGRTLGALPGFANAGRWDGILLKLRLSDGEIVATNQWGNAGIDGYGNLELDDAGHLFVSGQGSPPGQGGTDDLYLVAKHRTSDLGNVWRQLDPTAQQGFAASAEAWGGLAFVPDDTGAGEGTLVVAGWVISFGGANAFATTYSGLTAATPTIDNSIILTPPGQTAEWFMDSVVDSQGDIYLAGYTTGNLGGPHRGEGDAFIVKYDSNLRNPTIRQFGTARSDMFRYLEIDASDQIYATGYTYADQGGSPNADPTGRTGDVVVYKFDTNLNVLDKTQFGTPHEDRGISALFNDTLVIGGMTEAAMADVSRGSFDGYVVRLDADTLDVSQDKATVLAAEFRRETRQAVVITFDSDARNTLARGDLVLTNLSTGGVVPESVGTLFFNAAGTVATLDVTNQLANGRFLATIAGSDATVAFSVLAGDANNDGVVSIADFAILRANFGGGSLFSQGDFNYDSQVSIADFALLRANFGLSVDDEA